jgi:DNA-binding response OmpR family regulator
VNGKNIKTGLSILFVEDEEDIRETFVSSLARRYASVYSAADGIEGLEQYKKYAPDLIITDVYMPNMDGLEMIKKIRKEDKKTNIIISSAFSDKEKLLTAIELNLVKYLIKPYSFEELLAAIDNSTSEKAEIFEFVCGNETNQEKRFIYNIKNREISNGGESHELTQKESDLLTLLLQNNGNTVSYEQIEASVWKGEFMSDDALRSTVRKIRRKTCKSLIKNASGLGYKIIVAED